MGLTRDRRDPLDDEGAVLVVTLLLTVVLAAVVLALTTYCIVGLRSSRVTTERTASNVAAASAVDWAIEQFALKQLKPEVASDCDASPVPLAVPADLVAGASVAVTCQSEPLSSRGNPQVVLRSTAATADGTRRSIEVVLEVPAIWYVTQVNSWVVD